MLDYYASQFFAARQKKEKIADWIQRIQSLGSNFREAALLNCKEGAREGILDLSDRLRNICFVQGLASDRIQTIVRSRNYDDFDEIAETALVEESAIASRHDRDKFGGSAPLKCSTCGKLSHSSSRCYARERKEQRVNPVVMNSVSNMTCFRCGEKGHMARQCKKTTQEASLRRGRKAAGKRARTVGGQPPDRFLYSVGCTHIGRYDYVTLSLGVGREKELLFLVDSGADISLLKSKRLIGTKEFEPRNRVKIRSVDGSVLETHGSIETNICEGLTQIPFCFQLVSNQIDLPGDGIVGRDFLKQTQARLCYVSKTLTFSYRGFTIVKPLGNCLLRSELESLGDREGNVKLTPDRKL
jgi:hypothetical protein